MDHFFGQLAGESYHNADGSDRQAIIQKCDVGELLVLEHEPDNPHDINAIRVLRESGEQIGYLPRDFAGQVVSRIAKGYDFHAAIAGIGRARGGVGPYGVALLIIVDRDGVDRESVSEYAVRVLADRPRRHHMTPTGGRTDERAGSVIVVWVVVGVAIVLAALVLIRSLL
ncbi:MAG: hypothetical protein E6K73_13840 [Candidatus Eisenbacteria bacterium]|uniref:HIRAN domain-containing protein n=1 Tax=Eiseniibacteriota bacterium TaxID=2212470 RepID=A0A538S7H9_UNCEI|nr:MAG: hypothetical protein E6K73_13840 [Candidatus Eisenbacteria bacterium]